MGQIQVAANRYTDSASGVANLLRDARLPASVGPSILKSLLYFLEREGDPITPDFKSLQLLLSFVADHKQFGPPGLGLSSNGVVAAVWETPNVFRWSLEFLPIGEVRWTYLEKKEDGRIERATGSNRPDAVPLPARLQQHTASAS